MPCNVPSSACQFSAKTGYTRSARLTVSAGPPRTIPQSTLFAKYSMVSNVVVQGHYMLATTYSKQCVIKVYNKEHYNHTQGWREVA